MDTIQKIRTKYLDEGEHSYFNKFNTNDYTRFLEKEILKNPQNQVKNNVVLDGVSVSDSDNWVKEESKKIVDNLMEMVKKDLHSR